MHRLVILAAALSTAAALHAEHFAVTSRLHSVVAPRAAIDLCGNWEWRQVPHPRYERRGKATDWRTVTVPWTAVMNNDFRTIEHYRRTVDVPALDGKRAALHFAGLPGTTTIRVNGRLVATNWYPIAISYDVTDALRPGANEILLEMTMFDIPPLYEPRKDNRPGDPAYVQSGKFGLNRPLWLEFRDPVSILDTTVRTYVEPKKLFTADVVLTNGTDRTRRLTLTASVPDWSRTFAVELAPGSSKVVAVTNAWPTAALWTPDTPNLHYLGLALDEDGRRLDATRVRFGFREIRTQGDRLLLNGRPIMVRRVHPGGSMMPDDAHQGESVRRLKERGLNGIRTEIVNVSRLVDVADEEGLFISTFAECLAKARSATDVWWKRKYEFDALLYNAYKNSPGIVCWGMSNEFGSFYGLGGTNDALAVRRQQGIGRHYAEMDSTRPWTAYGDVEVGWPVRGPGPASIRSFHYPQRPTSDNACLPEMAWWYARRELSFQGISDRTKPLSISEDFYHGLTDQFYGAAKWAGDAIYTKEGYWKAWHDCVRMFADGYYEAGIACWNIWATADCEPTNRLYDLYGAMTPESLIALRETFPNVRAGTTERRTLSVYNRGFSAMRGRLVRRMRIAGKTIGESSRSLDLPPGGDWREREQLAFPDVRHPTELRIEYAFEGTERRFAERVYEFTVFPKESVRAPERLSVLGPAGFSLSGGVSADNVLAATNAGLPIVVAARGLERKEGQSLRDYVRRGGRVMLVEMPSDSWLPARLEKDKPQSFVWRRNDGALPGVTERMLRVWRPDTLLGDSGYTKSAKAAAEILADSGHAGGLTTAQVERLYDGKGSWFLVQLPVVSRLDVEPCAAFVLNAALAEFAKGGKKEGRLLHSAGDAFAAYAEKNAFVSAPAGEAEGTVWARDCGAVAKSADGKAFISFVRNGGTGVLLNAGTESAALLSRLGIVVGPADQCGWAVRRDNGGLMAGLSNEELFFANEKPSLKFWSADLHGETKPIGSRFKKLAAHPMMKGVLSLAEGQEGRVYTDPGILVEVPFGKGRMVALSLDVAKGERLFPAKTEALLRTLFLNLGVKTLPPTRDTYFAPASLNKVANRGLWADPSAPGVIGWFGDDNDMRYFPVNLCGWSPYSNNHCPKEPFPKTPVNFGGVPFLIPCAEKGAGVSGAALVLKPGESAKVGFWTYHIAGFHFLGAAATSENPPKKGERANPLLTATWAGEYGGKRHHEAKAEFFCGDHLNGYRWAQTVKSGRVAWTGPSKLDRDAVLYSWYAPNPLAGHQIVTELVLENTGMVPVAIVGLTTEVYQ